jgi:hypothetical protein
MSRDSQPGGTPDAPGTDPRPQLEDPDEPDQTQNDAPDAEGVDHGLEENPEPQEARSHPAPEQEGEQP